MTHGPPYLLTHVVCRQEEVGGQVPHVDSIRTLNHNIHPSKNNVFRNFDIEPAKTHNQNTRVLDAALSFCTPHSYLSIIANLLTFCQRDARCFSGSTHCLSVTAHTPVLLAILSTRHLLDLSRLQWKEPSRKMFSTVDSGTVYDRCQSASTML